MSRLSWWVMGLTALALAGCTTSTEQVAENNENKKIPITTQSEAARALYVEGRDLAEKLRAPEGQERFREAAALDEGFALAWYGQALAAQSTKEFWEALDRAKARVDEVSEGERLMILALDAGARSDPASQLRHLQQLTSAFPEDERAWNLLGTNSFGRQDYAQAIEAYEKAIAIAPDYSPPYNQLGYARRFLGDYDGAEEAFQKYIALLPDDPNPYDSYAELLMKTGRFEESIANYEKALERDPHFVASFVGIGLNHIYLGEPERARETFAKLAEAARTTGEKRAALFRTAQSWVFEGKTKKALEAVAGMSAISEQEGDKATMAGDLNLMGNILLEAGQLDEALAHYEKALAVNDEAETPEDARAAFRRNSLFNTARVAHARGDLDEAKTQAEDYAQQVAVNAVPFELRRSHHLNGLIALAEKDYAAAVAELQQANLLDPRVQYLLAQAHEGAGDAEASRQAGQQAAEHNGLNFNYAYVRDAAGKMLAEG
jgi:tetratricopeptide (TPR) repeat protein